ncbi:MAG TPA: hypothetical protein DIT93_07065 [Pelagibacterium sp.]|nr:hypothetical protein [Pelagibacterium sp.]
MSESRLVRAFFKVHCHYIPIISLREYCRAKMAFAGPGPAPLLSFFRTVLFSGETTSGSRPTAGFYCTLTGPLSVA